MHYNVVATHGHSKPTRAYTLLSNTVRGLISKGSKDMTTKIIDDHHIYHTVRP